MIFDDPEWREVRDAIARLERAVAKSSCIAPRSSDPWPRASSPPVSSSFFGDIFLHIFSGVLLLFILEQFVQIGILIGHKQYALAGIVPVNPASS